MILDFLRAQNKRFSQGYGNQLIHMATPAERASQKEFVEEIVEIGRKALNPASRTSGYAQRFEAGERDLMFVIDYGKYCTTTGDNSSLTRVNDALANL